MTAAATIAGRRTLGALGLSLALHLAVILLIELSAWPLPKEDPPVLVELLFEAPAVTADAPVVADPAAAPSPPPAVAEALAAPPRVAVDVPPPLPPRAKPQAEAPPRPSVSMDASLPADVAAATPAEAPSVPAASVAAVAQPAPPPGAGVAPPQNPAGGSYNAVLLRWLERYRDYPRMARLRRIEGVVVLRLTIERSGHLAEAMVAESSGSPLLDEAALSMARRAAPLPPLPQGEGVERVVMLVPIAYRLG